tara:strand:- start:651 stop:791 length:141 start_codon:yes stop_codon:yes gene_type:complete
LYIITEGKNYPLYFYLSKAHISNFITYAWRGLKFRSNLTTLKLGIS